MLQRAEAPPIASPPRARTNHVESGAAGHKQRRKAENSHCTARRARHHHAGHIENSAGLAEMREQIRQAIKKPTVSPCKQMPLSSQRDGANLASIFRTKKKAQKREPQQLGLTPLGPFSGPENGPHFGGRCRDALTHCRCDSNARDTQTLRNRNAVCHLFRN